MKERFLSLIETAFGQGIIKRAVFSRPERSEIKKVSARLCLHAGQSILALEYFLPGDTVSHKNIKEDGLYSSLIPLIEEYRQVNLITTVGEAEYRRAKDGREVILGEKQLKAKMSADGKTFEKAFESLDVQHARILTGSENFLIRLGISDKNGRVHDKKQAKFRQINRFLENIEDIYKYLPSEHTLTVYDLCSGKSYLSFAVYHYLTAIKGRTVNMLCVDLKREVIDYCNAVAGEAGFSGMRFICDDVTRTPCDEKPDMVISLHACDVASDIVIDRAISLSADVILSTPCCHRYLNGKIKRRELKFVTDYPHLSNKLCEAMTDAIRLLRLKKSGYSVACIELTDPENTPKNTLIRAVKNPKMSEGQRFRYALEYEQMLEFLLGEEKELYLKDI